MHEDEDPCGEANEKSRKYDVCLFPGAVEPVGRMDCSSDAFEGSICAEVADDYNGQTTSDHWDVRYATNVSQRL